MSDYNKPLPRINGDTRAFWNGCREHRLTFQKCRACGHVRWPASLVCPECLSEKTKWIDSRGKGRVYTFAVYHIAYIPEFKGELPYVTANVQLDEGPMMLSNIIGCPPDEVVCDMPVEVIFDDVTKDISLPKFRPVQLG